MKTTKRLLALLMAMTMLLSCLSPAAAAAELTDTADPAATESTQQTGSKTAISLWAFPSGDLTNDDHVSELITDFQAEYPGIELQVKVLSYQTGYAELEEAIADGNAPDLVLEAPETLAAGYGARGLLADLSDMVDDADLEEIYPYALAAGYGADGNLYQYPFYGTVHTMAINKTVFEAAGAMEYLDETTHTWNSTEDFFNAVQAVYEDTNRIVCTLPCESIGGDQGPRALVTNLYGGTFTNAAHTAYTWDSEEIINALQALRDCPGIEFNTDRNGAEEINALVSGEVNMAVVWNIAQHLNCSGVTADGDEILFMAFPSDDQPQLQNGIWGFSVFDNGNDDRIEAAKTFIKFMCDSSYTAEAVTATGFFPLRTSAEGVDLTGIWADDAVRNDFNSIMYMMGDYYQVTTNWRDARTHWVNLLHDVAAGADIAAAAARRNAEANGSGMTQISALVPAYGGASADWWAQFERDYELANPGVDLVLECVSWNDIYSRLDEGPTPDILNIDIYEQFVDRLLPVQEYMSQETYDKFYPCFLAQSQLDGTVWAVPDLTSARGLYVNTDMLDAIGMEAPATWAELEAVCEAIQSHYGDEVIPFGLDLSANEGQLAFALAAWNNGGGFLDEDGNWDLNSDANVEAVEFLIRMYSSGYTNDLSLNRYDIMDLFSQGQVAMMVAPSGWGPGVSHSVSPIPANEGCESWSLGIMDRMMCFDNDYTAEELDGITAFFDMFYDDARHADWVFMEGFLPATSTGMEQLGQDQNFLAPWVSILPNCKFYPANVEGWGTVRNGVIGVLGEASNGGDVRALLDDLQAQLTGGSGGDEDDHSPFLSFRWLDNWGDGWFQLDDWKYDGNDWCNGYLGFGAIPGDEFWMAYYLNTWNEETQSYDATPVHVDFSQQLSGTLLYDTDESIMPGAEDPEYYYRLNVLEDTWDQVAAISYTMDDGTVVTMELGIWRGEAGFYNSPALRNDTYIRDFYYDQINTDENVFYFGFQSDYWTLESVEPVLGHLGIPGHDASDVFTVEKVNNDLYKIALTPWAVSTGHSTEVGLNLYLTDPEGNSNNGEWYTSIWCHNGENEEPEAMIRLNHLEHRFYRTDAGDVVAYSEQFSGEYNENGDEVWLYGPTDLPEGVSYDLDTNTLTLDNASLEELSLSFAADDWQHLPSADVTIMLMGDNTISSNNSHAVTFNDNVNVTICGDGSLTLYSENAIQTDENGNYFSYNTVNMYSNASLTIAGNAAVTVEIAGEALETCWDGDTWLGDRPAQLAAVEGGMGSLTLKDNGSLTTIVPEGSRVNGPKLENEDQVFWGDWYPGGCRGIRSMGTITIMEGSTLDTQEIEIPSYWDENGFVGAGSFIQSGGTVNITAHGSYGETEKWEWNEETQEDVYLGIVDHYHYTGLSNYEGDYVEISGGQLNIKCLQTEEEMASSAWADGIRVGPEGEMIVSGGTVNVQTNRGYAVTVDNLTITDGAVNVNDAIGSQNLVISGGTVTVEDHEGTVLESANITMSGGKVIGSSRNGTGLVAQNIKITDGLLDITCQDGYVVDVSNSFEVSGGTVNLSGKYGDVLNLCGADAKITGGIITLTGEECQIMGVGGWDETDDGSQDGKLTMSGGKLVMNSGDTARGMEIRARGSVLFTGNAQVELNGGWLDTRGQLTIAENASLDLTNTQIGVHENGIMTIDGGSITVNSVWNDNLEENCIYIGRTAQMIVNGGKLTVDAVDFCKGIMSEGTYTQNGGEVTVELSGDRIGYTYHEDTDSYTYFPGFAFSSGGYTTINDGVLNLTAHDAFEQFYSDWDAENPDSRKTKLTVNGGTLNLLGEYAGFDIMAPAEFNGGDINVHSTGLYIPFRDMGLVNGILVRHNGYDDPQIASAVTINGGNFNLISDVPGDNWNSIVLYTAYSPFAINGGTIRATGGMTMYDIGYNPNLVVADHMNIVSVTSADSKELLGQYFEDSYTDEDGFVVTETLYLGTVEEDEIPCDPFTDEGWDLCTDILITDNSCGKNITWMLDSHELILTGTGSTFDYASSDETPWSILLDKITSVSVDAGITGIGDYTFAGLRNGTVVTFLGQAPAFDANAFSGSTCTAYYVKEYSSWTPAVRQNYGGKVTWQTLDLVDVVIPAKPYKITNVVSGVHVYWNAVEGATKYGLWRSETGLNGTYKWVANPKVPHFTDTTAQSGKTYYYKVTVVDASGVHSQKSDAIGIVYVATPDITTRTNTGAGIQLGWQKIQGATGYAIYRKSYEGSDAWVRIGTISGNSTFTWTDTSVKNNNGQVYKYTIRALAGSNMKTLSGCRNAGRTMTRLSSQVLTSATVAGTNSIKCKWTTSSRVDGYEVRFLVNGQVYKTYTIGNYKTGTRTFTGLKAGQTYTIQVRTYKKVTGVGSFYSDWSTAKTVTLK